MADGTTGPDRPVAAWQAVLARLEDDACRLEEQLRSPGAGSPPPATPPPWTPPVGLGALPPALAGRAAALLAREQDLARALATSLAELAPQRQFADRVSATVTARQPAVYVDVTT